MQPASFGKKTLARILDLFTLDVAQEFRKNSTVQQKRPLFGLPDYVMQLMAFDTIISVNCLKTI